MQGRRREPGRTTLSAAEVRETPGAFGDAFRAVEVLPGVTPPLGGVPYFFVRGAPPNANGTFVDGIRVPLLFHVGLGPPRSVQRASTAATTAGLGSWGSPCVCCSNGGALRLASW